METSFIPDASLTGVQYVYTICGPLFLCGILSAGFVVFVGVCFVALSCRSPGGVASFFPWVFVPLIVGLWGTFAKIVRVMTFLQERHGAASDETFPDLMLQVLYAFASSTIPAALGFAAMLPAFFVLSLALFIRAMRAEKTPREIPD